MSTALERVLADKEKTERPVATTGPPAGAFGPGIAAAAAAIGLSLWALGDAVTGNVTETGVVRAVLCLAWASAGAVMVRRPASRHVGLVALGGSALGAAACLVQDLRPVAAGLLPAAGFHLLLAHPESLPTQARRVMTAIGYAVGAAVAIGLFVARPDYPLWPVSLEIVLALLVGGVASIAHYAKMSGLTRRRMEWLGWAVTFSAGVIVLLSGLKALVDWPPATGAVAAGVTLVIPAALAASTSRRLTGAVDVVLTSTISLAGLTVVVVGVYLAIVLGLGRVPRHNERTLLVLSMAAAGLAALLYLPAHRRLREFAARLVYGERTAPDEVIRNFGARLSRSVPLDELFLQMVESLRKTLGLSSAEVWRASGGTVERMVSDPEAPPAELTLTTQE